MGRGVEVAEDLRVGVEGVVGAQGREGLRDAGQGVVGGVDEAGVVVGPGTDTGGQAPGFGAYASGGRVDGGDGAVPGGGGREPLGDEGRGVTAGHGARRDAAAGRGGAGHAVEAEDAPVVLGDVVREEVPEAARGDQVAGFRAAGRGRAVAGGVVEGEDLVVAAGDGERGEEGRGGARPAVLPGDAGDGALEGGDLAAQAARQDLFEFGQRAQGRLLDPGQSPAAVRRATATATASSSSRRSGGRSVPEARR